VDKVTNLRILVIAPAHNEENGIAGFVERVLQELPRASILIVDDSSTDKTWEKLISQKLLHKNLHGISLQRNVGQQRAILAGFQFALDQLPQFDYFVTMDADGQDPEDCIPLMLTVAQNQNVDLVVGYRKDRSTDSIWKRFPASIFYYTMGKIFKVKLTPHAAEFRVLTPHALAELLSYGEARPFWRGLVEYSGLSKVDFNYTRRKRNSDATSYGIKQMLKLAETGIVSFSQAPLRFVFLFGLITVALSFTAIIGYLISYIFFGSIVQGWLSLILLILLFGGVQMLSLGIIGIYLIELLENVRNRPQFSIKSRI
jgi:glycosyltransferase involved in cell wall biosynthesis